MAINQLPPQAYTREILSEAYAWLHKQPPGIKELATNADSLVSLYMQYRRRPNATAQTLSQAQNELSPQSSESFKQDLKNLAHGLKQFDEPQASAAFTNHTQTSTTPVNKPYTEPPPVTEYQTPASIKYHLEHSTDFNPTASTFIEAKPLDSRSFDVRPTEARSAMTKGLDARSIEALKNTQIGLNLSSENEALRVLISLGYESLKNILPKRQ